MLIVPRSARDDAPDGYDEGDIDADSINTELIASMDTDIPLFSPSAPADAMGDAWNAPSTTTSLTTTRDTSGYMGTFRVLDAHSLVSAPLLAQALKSHLSTVVPAPSATTKVVLSVLETRCDSHAHEVELRASTRGKDITVLEGTVIAVAKGNVEERLYARRGCGRDP
ncbi:hypothetical protein EV714DRAFT_240426 [Schizophyllum commune]